MTVAAGSGFGGKPRPALVLQANEFQALSTVTLALFTSDLTGANLRPHVEPSPENGLLKPSELMVDLVITVKRARLGDLIGHLNDSEMYQAEHALRIFLDLT